MSFANDLIQIKEGAEDLVFKAANREQLHKRHGLAQASLEKDLAEMEGAYPVGSAVTLRVKGSDREAFNYPERHGKIDLWVIAKPMPDSLDKEVTAVISWQWDPKRLQGYQMGRGPDHTSYVPQNEFIWGIQTKQMTVTPSVREAEDPIFKGASKSQIANRPVPVCDECGTSNHVEKVGYDVPGFGGDRTDWYWECERCNHVVARISTFPLDEARPIFKPASAKQLANRPKPVKQPWKTIYINGYWVDDPSHPFENYKCKVGAEWTEEQDDPTVFYYFDSMEDVEYAVAHPEQAGSEFVITSYTLEEARPVFKPASPEQIAKRPKPGIRTIDEVLAYLAPYKDKEGYQGIIAGMTNLKRYLSFGSREKIIDTLVTLWREAENSYLEAGVDYWKDSVKDAQDACLLSEEEQQQLEDGCNSLGI